MNGALSVNEAISQLNQRAGTTVCVVGILSFDFEDVSLWHFPKAERGEYNDSSLWLSTGYGSMQFDEHAMRRLSGHRVQVLGTLHGPDPVLGGCGHMSGFPAEILVSSIDRL